MLPPSYTLFDLRTEVSGEKFLLPFGSEVSDESIIEQTMKLITDTKIDEQDSISARDFLIQIDCNYEGYDGYYPFMILLEVFRFKKDPSKSKKKQSCATSFFDQVHEQKMYTDKEYQMEVADGQWMVSLRIEHEQGSSLFDELIDIKFLPFFKEKLNLKKYYKN